jgi:hypothetical protein
MKVHWANRPVQPKSLCVLQQSRPLPLRQLTNGRLSVSRRCLTPSRIALFWHVPSDWPWQPHEAAAGVPVPAPVGIADAGAKPSVAAASSAVAAAVGMHHAKRTATRIHRCLCFMIGNLANWVSQMLNLGDAGGLSAIQQGRVEPGL